MDLGCQSPKENKEVFYFMTEEIFKFIPGYEGHYEVSNMGNVVSVKFNKKLMLKPNHDKNGYKYVNLYNHKGRKTYKIHQLVAIVFLNHTPCGMKMVIDHINDNKQDNRVDNLQIVTARENAFKTQGNYTSKYKGVCWDNSTNRWRANIVVNKKQLHLGLFTKEYEAHLVYEKALIDYGFK